MKNSGKVNPLIEAIATAKTQLELVTAQLEMIQSGPGIERCGLIVMFPEYGLTVDINELKQPFITNKVIATQFNMPYASAILEFLKNGAGERPVLVTPRDYYTAEVARRTAAIAELEEIAGEN